MKTPIPQLETLERESAIKTKTVALAGYQFELIVDTEEDHALVLVEKLAGVPQEQTGEQLRLFGGPLPE